MECDTEVWSFVCNYEYTSVENGRYVGVRIYTEQVDFDMADQFCSDKFGSTLASIHNERDNIRAAETIDSFNTLALFGLYNITSSSVFEWTDSTDYDLDNEHYNNWAPNEPDYSNSNGENDCGYFSSTVDITNPQWWDTSCDLKVFWAFVCNRNPAYVTYEDDNGYIGINSPTFDLDWYDASEMCQTHFGDLASINSQQDQINIVNVIDESFGDNNIEDNHVWIGLNDQLIEGSFAWSDSTQFSYSNWGNNQPNDYNNGQDCVELRTDFSDQWNDQACDYQTSTFVCNQEHTTYESDSYIGVVSTYESFTWDEANNYCNDKYSTQLASIHSDDDQTEINTILDELNIHYGWIGLKDSDSDNEYNDDGWIDGSSLSFTNWIYSQPSASYAQCVEVVEDNGGRWNDEDCSWSSSGFICNLRVEISETTNYIGVKMTGGSKITWNDASEYCATNFFTTLASVHSNDEINEIYGIITLFDSGNAGVGMYYDDDKNDWAWQDKTDMDMEIDWWYLRGLNYYPDDTCVFLFQNYRAPSYNGYINYDCDETDLTVFVCNKLTTHDDIDDDQTDDWTDYAAISRTATASNNNDGDSSEIDDEYDSGVIYDFDDGLSDFGKGDESDSDNNNGNGNDESYVVWIVGVLTALFVVGLIVGSVIWYRRKKQSNARLSDSSDYKSAIDKTDMEMVTKKTVKVGYAPPQDVEYLEPSADEMMDSEPQKIY